jgi:hypothetical protein
VWLLARGCDALALAGGARAVCRYGVAVDVEALRARFQLLASDVEAFRAERVAGVVRWVLATAGAALHRREPLYGERGSRRWAGELVDHALPEERSGCPAYGTVYGLDGRDRFVVARSSFGGGGSHHVEQFVWEETSTDRSAPDGEGSTVAFTAHLNHLGELTALAAVELVDGVAVCGWHVDAWTSIEDRYGHAGGRVTEIRSLRVNVHCPATHRELRAWRATYDEDGGLVLLMSALAFLPFLGGGDKHVDPGVLGEAPWPAVDAWVEDPRTGWHAVWDARLDRRERDLPSIDAALAGLEDGLTQSAVRAADAAIKRGECLRPFVLTYQWTLDRVVPRRGWLGADSLRTRAVELGVQDTAVIDAVRGGTRVDLFEYAAPDTLRRIRQVTQLTEYGRLPWLPAPTQDELIEAARAFHRRLIVALNQRKPAGVTDDFLVWADGEDMRSAVGFDRAEAFRAAMTPPPRPAARVGRVTGSSSIERFATRLGLATDAQRIAATARWSFTLIAAAPGRARSKLGGLPSLPAGEPWPTWNGTPLSFIGEIHLGEIPAGHDPPALDPELPAQGVLLFFADLLDWTGDPEPPSADGPIRVVHFESPPAQSGRRPPPGRVWSERAEAEVDLPTVIETPVAFERRLTLPERLERADFWSSALYTDLRNRLHRSQRDRGVNAQFLGYPTDGEDPAQDDQRLLLRVGYHQRTEFAYQDGGEIYFHITPQAARQQRWQDTTAEGISG